MALQQAKQLSTWIEPKKRTALDVKDQEKNSWSLLHFVELQHSSNLVKPSSVEGCLVL
jgi:hypothetical protein